MDNRGLKTIIYIVIGVLVVGFIFRVLPYLLLGGVVAYGAYKGYKFIADKFGKKKNTKFNENTYTNVSGDVSISDDEDISQAIDVDYKDV